MSGFRSRLGAQLLAFLDLKRAMGRQYLANEAELRQFDEYVASAHPHAIRVTREVAHGWLVGSQPSDREAMHGASAFCGSSASTWLGLTRIPTSRTANSCQPPCPSAGRSSTPKRRCEPWLPPPRPHAGTGELSGPQPSPRWCLCSTPLDCGAERFAGSGSETWTSWHKRSSCTERSSSSRG